MTKPMYVNKQALHFVMADYNNTEIRPNKVNNCI